MTSLIGRNRGGFTLIELILVTLIIVILVGISTPLFRRTYHDLQLNETAYNIARFMSYARAKAISERINTRVNFDFEIGKYWLTQASDPERPDQYGHIKGRLGRFHSAPTGISLSGQASLLEFYPNGRSADFKLIIEGRGDEERIIEVKGQTGEPAIIENK